MKLFFCATVALLVAPLPVRAEIMCTDLGGCWETGKHIRLLNGPRGTDTTLINRNGSGRVDVRGIPIGNDMPHQRGPHFVTKPVPQRPQR
jgi:hypothetical protein